VIQPGAFARTVRVDGATRVTLRGHDVDRVIGVGIFTEDAYGLLGKYRFVAGVQDADETLKLVAAGAITGISIGYTVADGGASLPIVPIVAITGQVGSAAIGTDAFQEADIRGITMPITKHSYLITKPADIAPAIAAAFHIAGTGRPGPVLVDITKDALQARTRFQWPRQLDLRCPGGRPHGKQLREAGRLIAESRRPVLCRRRGREARAGPSSRSSLS
jgi:glyoxylate carboligase